jgi:hypothetical protein
MSLQESSEEFYRSSQRHLLDLREGLTTFSGSAVLSQNTRRDLREIECWKSEGREVGVWWKTADQFAGLSI